MDLRLKNRATSIAFIVGFGTLVAQILVHRIISAKLLNNYAFLVISLTMLGFACSGVILSRSLNRWLQRFDEMVVIWTALFVISTLGTTVLFYHLGASSPFITSRSQFIESLLKTLPYALLFAVPFIFSGLLLGILLSSPNLPTRRIYCSDLVGSACGALLVLPAISLWGVESTLLGVCVILLAITSIATYPIQKRMYSLTLVAAIAVILCFAFEESAFALRYPEGTPLANAANANSKVVIEHIRWDPVARIEVSQIPPPNPAEMFYPSLIGNNKEFHARFRKMLTQNNYAFTYAVAYDGKPESLNGIEETIYSSAYIAGSTPNPKTAIIGVGGGFDVLTALHFHAREITGIEVNKATLRILQQDYADYFRAWATDPRVKLVYDDGRHFLKNSSELFDIIQLSGVDSYSGTSGAAHVFSESYLYTTEAFELYLSRLSPDGILNVMRLEHPQPREMLRVLATAIGALRNAGIKQPADHLIMVSQKNGAFMALLVKKTPFTKAEEDKVATWTSTNLNLRLAVAPHFEPEPKSLYQLLLSLKNPGMEEAFLEQCPYNVRPATDNLPFFFNFSRWSHLPFLFPFSLWADWPGIKNIFVPVMEITLIVMLLFVCVIALLCVWLPIRRLTHLNAVSAPKRHAYIFAGTALGYLGVEIALLQKFGLYLGHPNYAMSVVLAGLLFSTGIGSLYSAKICDWLRGHRNISFALAFFVLLECVIIFPNMEQWAIKDFYLRVAIVLTLIFPLGALMGTYVPAAVEQLKATNPDYVPWAWGVNGVFSVLAPILSIAFSMTWGIDALLLSCIPIYLAVSWLFPKDQTTVSGPEVDAITTSVP